MPRKITIEGNERKFAEAFVNDPEGFALVLQHMADLVTPVKFAALHDSVVFHECAEDFVGDLAKNIIDELKADAAEGLLA